MEHRVTDADGVRTFQLGDVALQSGETLRDARLAYATHGELSAEGDNAVLFPPTTEAPTATTRGSWGRAGRSTPLAGSS